MMSIFSDHDCGALSDEDFERECTRMNNRDRVEREKELDKIYSAMSIDDFIKNELLKPIIPVPHGRGNGQVIALSTLYHEEDKDESGLLEDE